MTRRIIAALCCALVLAACGAQATQPPDTAATATAVWTKINSDLK